MVEEGEFGGLHKVRNALGPTNRLFYDGGEASEEGKKLQIGKKEAEEGMVKM